MHLWLPCRQAENSSSSKSSDLQRTFRATPRGAPQLQAAFSHPAQLCDPQITSPSCCSLAPSHPIWAGKDGQGGKGCRCCWFHMAQLAQAGSEFGCLMGIPCQSFPFQQHSVHQLPAWFPGRARPNSSLLMGTHSLQLICCFPVLLFSTTNYKTSMLCRSCKIPSRTSVTCNRARALGGCSNQSSPKF